MLIFLDLYFNSNVYRYNSSLTDLCSVSLLLDNGLITVPPFSSQTPPKQHQTHHRLEV